MLVMSWQLTIISILIAALMFFITQKMGKLSKKILYRAPEKPGYHQFLYRGNG